MTRISYIALVSGFLGTVNSRFATEAALVDTVDNPRSTIRIDPAILETSSKKVMLDSSLSGASRGYSTFDDADTWTFIPEVVQKSSDDIQPEVAGPHGPKINISVKLPAPSVTVNNYATGPERYANYKLAALGLGVVAVLAAINWDSWGVWFATQTMNQFVSVENVKKNLGAVVDMVKTRLRGAPPA